MDRRTLTIALITVLAIFALGITAATLTATVSPGGDGDNDQSIFEIEDPPEEEEEDDDDDDVPAFLEWILIVLSVLLLIGVLAFFALYRRRALGLIITLSAVVVLFYLFSTLITPDLESAAFNESEFLPGEGGSDGSGEGDGEGFESTSPLLLLGALGLLGLVSMAVLLGKRRVEETSVEESGQADSDDTEELARIAGQAADRIESQEPDGPTGGNEVFRAWKEMIEQLDVDDPETTTPREFEQLAVEAGMDRGDVGQLTRLFETVRYGGATPTEDREQRAVSVLRRIESKYGESK